MLDLKFIEENADKVREMLAARNVEFDVDEVLDLAAQRRAVIGDAEAKRAEHNRANEAIAAAKRKGRDVEAEVAAARQLGDAVKDLSARRAEVEDKLQALLLYIPNVPHSSVPVGKDEADNEVRGSWGEPRAFDFPPRPHWEIGEMLGVVDFERAVKVAGARFTMTAGAGARLERALQNLMLDEAAKRGYVEVNVPYMVLEDAMVGTGQLPKFSSDMYSVVEPLFFEWARQVKEMNNRPPELDDLPADLAEKALTAAWLIPTAEVPVTNLHREEILAADELPIKYAAFTPCFRREAGAPGRDTRGMIRVHQFLKVELVKIVHPETSYEELESLVADARNILELLDLPYREVVLSTGDLGFGAAKCVDIEVWIPSEDKYREISSCSNYEAFQARRMNTRFRPAKGAKPEFVHTLNGSGLAIGRTLVAILENFQNADGSVTIPDALRPYMDGRDKIG
jgi:seryl-tRNA synthetase